MKMKLLALFMAATAMTGLLTGCGTSGSSTNSMMDMSTSVTNSALQEEYGVGAVYDTYAAVAGEVEYERDETSDGGVSENQTQNLSDMTLLEEKLVYHCSLDIETLDYPSTMAAIKDMIAKYGGVIQSESESDSGHDWYYQDYRKTTGTMHNYMQVRIPSKDYDNFLADLDGAGKVVSKSTSVDNISQQYYDTTAQIEALQIQERNLLGMLEKCETIEDMITVEQRLSEVQYELNSLQTNRRYMDMDVAYSYVNISISEVMEYRLSDEPVRRNTFIDRLKNTVRSTGRGFLAFLEGFLFLLIRLVPYILIIGVIYFAFLRKKIHQWKETKRTQRMLYRQSMSSQMPPQVSVNPQEKQNLQENQEQH